MGNKNMIKARKNKNDEFYTQLTDIEKELEYYKDHFRGKIIYMNCDDPKESEFWRYFHLNFNELGLKKMISTHYDENESTYKLEYTGENDNDISVGTKTKLMENGDFRSDECIELLKESDIVVTNPPFSLFREYVAQLFDYNKDFIIWGNMNAVTYKEIFPLIKNGEMWLGNTANKTCVFRIPNHYKKWDIKITEEKNDGWKYAKVPSITVYTNLDIKKRHEKIILWKEYNEKEFPKYDNYNAIEVNKVVNIPKDYDGIMGVPITYLDKHNPEQFEILGKISSGLIDEFNLANPTIDGINKYKRLAIKRIKDGRK